MPEAPDSTADEPPQEVNIFGKYELGKLLGCGAFAKVYHAREIRTGQSVAIKAVSKQKIVKGGFTEHVKREISIMRRMRHPHVVRLFEVLATKSKIYFVMEFAKGGELFQKLAKGRFSEDLSRRYFQQLISAVEYCHSRGVFHRDLKPENLLLDENWNLKVSDFGLSAVRDQIRPDGLLHTLCGTPAYVAPEILAKKGYGGAPVDVWSCGVVLYVLTAGYLPFNDTNLMVMYRKIYKGEFRFPKWTSPDLRRFISRLLDTNTHSRITVGQIIRDPWFTVGLEKDIITSRLEDHHLDDFKDWDEERDDAKSLNAFDLISFSPGLNLTGLVGDSQASPLSREWFVSSEKPERIIEKIVEVSAGVKARAVKRREWGIKLEGENGSFVACFDIHRLAEKAVVVEVRNLESDCMTGQISWKQKLSSLFYQPPDSPVRCQSETLLSG